MKKKQYIPWLISGILFILLLLAVSKNGTSFKLAGSPNTNNLHAEFTDLTPKNISGMIKYVLLSRITYISPQDIEVITKPFTNKNKTFTFNYPSSMFAWELSDGSGILISANSSDRKEIDRYDECLNSEQKNSESGCGGIIIGPYLSLLVIDTQDFINDYLSENKGNAGRGPGDGGLDSEWVLEDIKYDSKARTVVNYDWASPIYRYEIKFWSAQKQKYYFIIISTSAYPAVTPYRETIRTLVNSFKGL